VKTAVPIHTPKEPATAVCSGAEFEKSQKRSSKAAAYLYTYRKLLVRIGAVVLGAVAIAAIATIRNTPEVSVATAVPSQTVTEAEKAEAAVASEPTAAPVTDAAKSTAPLIGDFGFSLGSPDQSIVTPPTIKTKEPLTAPKAEATSSPAAPAVVAEAPRPSPQPSTIRKEFVEVAVQLTIQDGRVAEAHIGNRQPGAEAFEATALHIARQRRYPPGTSRTETLVVRVANQFGSKE
jgi:cytoskeletal protein RodZ